jgi:hypothetical protein
MLDLPHGGRSDSMRPIHLVSLMALAVLAFAVHAQSSPRPPRPPKPVQPPPAQVTPAQPVAEETPFPVWNVKEAGQTLDDAEEMAQKKALEEIQTYLAQPPRSLRWQPDLPWVKDQQQPLLTHKAVEEGTLPSSGLPVHWVSYDVQLTPQAYRKAIENDRQLTMQDRQFLLGKILAGLVAVFTAFAGYYRLEEATKGYYTNLLRLGALGLVGAVGAGIYLLS